MELHPYFFPKGYKAPTPEEVEALHAQAKYTIMGEYAENGIIDVYGAIDVEAEEIERNKDNG